MCYAGEPSASRRTLQVNALSQIAKVRTNEGRTRDALTILDHKLKTMTRDGEEFDVDLWSEAALTQSAHWEDVRRQAHSALAAFGWSAEPRE